jgi:hypothetical protein
MYVHAVAMRIFFASGDIGAVFAGGYRPCDCRRFPPVVGLNFFIDIAVHF